MSCDAPRLRRSRKAAGGNSRFERKRTGMKKRALYKCCGAMLAGCMSAGMLSGCGGREETVEESLAAVGQGQEQQAADAVASAEVLVDPADMFTDRDRSGEYDESECIRLELDSDTVTITEEGIYILSGSLEGGMVVVDADESAKVQLVLDNVDISNPEGAAVYVRQADKVFITLAEGTVNTLSGGDSYVSIDENNIDGVIFSKDDVTINGEGSLNITAVTGHGIVSKDDLKVTGGSVTVSAPGHGLSGKDSVRVAGGTLNITAGKDGIHAENTTDTSKGYVYIQDGSVTVDSEGDCISAGAWLQIDGGTFNLTSGKGSASETIVRGEDGNAVSTKGIKAATRMSVNGGSFHIDAQDDALHSDGGLTVSGGEYSIATGDDGLHAEETVTVAGGTVDISACYEGIEGTNVVISGGNIRINATDDGLNAAGGNDGSGFGGRFGGDFGRNSGSQSSILISGGTIYVNAAGDGIDSNGNITVTGGKTYVSGPESSANGAIDYEGSAQITGGILVAVGSSGMAMNFGEDSTQGSALVSVSGSGAGTEIALEDVVGNVLVSYTSESRFDSVVVSCPEMVQGGTYILRVGEEKYEIVLDSLIYGNGFGGFGGMGGFGGPGGRGGAGGKEGGQMNRPEGGMPEGGRPGMPGAH